jgi:molybdate transport system substrate-binding protein
MSMAVRSTPRRWALAALLLGASAWAQAQTLTVSAAASLGDAMKAIAPLFEAHRPGVTLRFNLAASGVLLQQLAAGAPVDAFASADEETMDRAVAQKLVDPATRRVLATNTLLLVAPAGSRLAGLDALAGPGVRRIALGKPASVPAGRYAQQALEARGQWAALQPKLVPADNVRQVLDYVARGEVDAGFVYATDAATATASKVRVVAPVAGHAAIRYPVAVAADSRHAAAARAFVQFLASPAAQAVLRQQGFGAP